jgi:hypothetical protein
MQNSVHNGFVMLPSILPVFAILSALLSPSPQQSEEWSMVVLPDTQYYTRDWPFLYSVQTQWIADNWDRLNIKFVMHEGDITNDNTVAQWNAADAAHDILDAAGIPYAMTTGNHDYGPSGNGSSRNTSMNNANYFPVSRFSSMPTFGGTWQTNRSENNWHTFQAGGRKWLALSLEFGPRDAVIDWAHQVIFDHPDHSVFIATHAYTYWDGNRLDDKNRPDHTGDPHDYGMDNGPGAVNDGQELWEKLVSKHPNVFMVFSGHIGFISGRQTAWGDFGNPVYELLSDFQSMDFGGSGYLRIMTFKADGRTVDLHSYSPWLNTFLESGSDQFVIEPQDSHGLGMTPSAVYSVDGPGDDANFTADNQSGGWNVFKKNEGDFIPKLNGRGFLSEEGVLMATVAENGRDHGFGVQYGVAEAIVGGAWITSPYSSLSTCEAGPVSAAGSVELNIDVATAFFPFAGGWLGGYLRATTISGKGKVFRGSRRIQLSHVEELADGRWRIQIPGVHSLDDGMLFSVGSGDGDNVTAVTPLTFGNGWDLVLRDSGGDIDQFERHNFSFVFVPYTAKGLTGALIADDGSTIQSAGSFSMIRLAAGQYQLSIPNQTPDSGMLLLNVCGDDQGYPDDNLLSYQKQGNDFIIESRDLPGLALEDTQFTFAFINYADGIALQPTVSASAAIAGQNMEFELHHFTPNSTAHVGFSFATQPMIPTSAGPLFLTGGFEQIMKVQVDVNGSAHGWIDLPIEAQGVGIWCQAADPVSWKLSNYVSFSIE